ncbi:MAG: helix-turn-helix transcriptional regulator [Steroidobacteraceae bacterium]
MSTTQSILINRKQASELTGLSERYFDHLRRRGVLRTYKTDGGLHRFYRSEVLEHIGANFKPQTIAQK